MSLCWPVNSFDSDRNIFDNSCVDIGGTSRITSSNFQIPRNFRVHGSHAECSKMVISDKTLFRVEFLQMNLQSVTNIAQLSLQRLKNVLMHSRSSSVLVAL
jgi:hypothetical protein